MGCAINIVASLRTNICALTCSINQVKSNGKNKNNVIVQYCSKKVMVLVLIV